MKSFSDSHYWLDKNENASETVVAAGMNNHGFNCLEEPLAQTDENEMMFEAA